MPEYINPNSYTVHLLGPDGKQLLVKSKQKIILSEYYDRYVARGFIKRVAKQINQTTIGKSLPNTQAQVHLTDKPRPQPQTQQSQITREQRKQKLTLINRAKRISNQQQPAIKKSNEPGKRLIVGKKLAADATQLLNDNLNSNCYPISNNIAVGILSYNRLGSLKRLINSIIKYTDLRKTTIFVSDDGSDDPAIKEYLKSLKENSNIVVIINSVNLGVAGNSNRLIRCLARFEFGMILNDDIEILQEGWEYFYVEAMKKTGFHHFMYRENGVYGAKLGDLQNAGDFHIRKTDDRPHGAVLAFTREMLVKCGYFDTSYGKYGMEHVDWSMKPYEFGLQIRGFYDVEGSDSYFKLHSDKSAVDNDKSSMLSNARKVFSERIPGTRILPGLDTIVPEITFIVPFRNIDREESIITVISNLRAQRFPVVHIVMIEQDSTTKININKFKPVNYYLAEESNRLLFNKSLAFNRGVVNAPSDKIILHDADMLVTGDYATKVFEVLDSYESCHLGGTVIYTSKESTDSININKSVEIGMDCERAIGYYEGGSLACTRTAYWNVGAFNEDYWGYGCEDCDFYARLSNGSKWFEDRKFDLLHLWHGRVDGWDKHHKENKKLESELKKLNIEQRIALQISQLKRLGYGEFLHK